jgi:hypothetical protein
MAEASLWLSRSDRGTQNQPWFWAACVKGWSGESLRQFSFSVLEDFLISLLRLYTCCCFRKFSNSLRCIPNFEANVASLNFELDRNGPVRSRLAPPSFQALTTFLQPRLVTLCHKKFSGGPAGVCLNKFSDSAHARLKSCFHTGCRFKRPAPLVVFAAALNTYGIRPLQHSGREAHRVLLFAAATAAYPRP